MKKNLIIFIAVIALSFSFAACSNHPAANSTATTATADSTPSADANTPITFTEPTGYTKVSVAGTTTFSKTDLTKGISTITVLAIPKNTDNRYDYASLSADDATKLLSNVKGLSNVVTTSVAVDGVDGTKITYDSVDNDITKNFTTIMFENGGKVTEITASGKQGQTDDLLKDFDNFVDTVKVSK